MNKPHTLAFKLYKSGDNHQIETKESTQVQSKVQRYEHPARLCLLIPSYSDVLEILHTSNCDHDPLKSLGNLEHY